MLLNRSLMGWKPLFGALLTTVTSVSQAAPFFFIQLADPQFGMFTGDKGFAQETANMEFAVATINRLRPAFVIVSGDLVNKPGDAGQMAEYKRVIGKVLPEIPVYAMAGNHDIGGAPDPVTIGAYTNQFGSDYYTFRHGDLTGVVLNSTIIHSPKNSGNELAAQEQWLQRELKNARERGTKHIVIFAHHPWFLRTANEPDEYFNMPNQRRSQYLAWFREAGVKHLFSGHYHRNAVARDAGLESIVTGPVGKPLGDAKSGLRIVVVSDRGIQHRFYHFGELPAVVDPQAPLNGPER